MMMVWPTLEMTTWTAALRVMRPGTRRPLVTSDRVSAPARSKRESGALVCLVRVESAGGLCGGSTLRVVSALSVMRKSGLGEG